MASESQLVQKRPRPLQTSKRRSPLSNHRITAHLVVPVSMMILATTITTYIFGVTINVTLEQSNPIQQALLAQQQHQKRHLAIAKTSDNNNNNNNKNENNKQKSQGSQKAAAIASFIRQHMQMGQIQDGEQSRQENQMSAWVAAEAAFKESLLYPRETPISNPTVVPNGTTSFGACLLVMDDNHRLVEWLAYHFHVLPLRYLIVASDPRSRTSPTYLFNRWRRQGMYIEEWKDADFWRPRYTNGTVSETFVLKPILEDTADWKTKRDRHRGRQKYFYRSCLLAMKRANRTWVALHDSDEFLVYNHPKAREGHENSASAAAAANQEEVGRIHQPAYPPPTTAQPGAMIQYLERERAAGTLYYKSPCIGVPRLSFGAQPDEELAKTSSQKQQQLQQQQQQKAPPPQHGIQPGDGLDTAGNTRFLDTLRWRKHATRDDFVKNALGKVIMDVSRIEIANYPFFDSLHRPIKELCAPPWHRDLSSGLRINHYLGSWESYSFRTRDARKGGERSLEQWEYKATTNTEETDDTIRPWISGFVQEQGNERAQTLLHGAGILPEGYVPLDKEWRLRQEMLDKILSTKITVANDNKMVQFDAWVREKYGPSSKEAAAAAVAANIPVNRKRAKQSNRRYPGRRLRHAGVHHHPYYGRMDSGLP